MTEKILLLMNKAGITVKDREIIRVANDVEKETGEQISFF